MAHSLVRLFPLPRAREVQDEVARIGAELQRDGGERIELHVKPEQDIGCVLVEAKSASEAGLARAARALDGMPGALAAAQLQAQAAAWKTDPAGLVRAALGAPSHEIASHVLTALLEGDGTQWPYALMAAMMLPREESLWIVGLALARERDAARRGQLEQSNRLLHGGHWQP